jgi:outer membrane protein assembly factor BamA
MVHQVDIDGEMLTDISYIQRQFQFHEGDPVDYSRINLTRKKLYDTGLFKRVEINVNPEKDGYTTRVHLNENAPLRFRYGFAVANRLQTSDRQLGVTADLTYGNLFGRGISLGTNVKAQQQERDARVFASFPEFRGRRVITTGTLFRTRDRSIPETTQYFAGLTGQQQWRLTDYYVLTYDFTYQKVHALGPRVSPLDPAVTDFRYNIGRINISLSRDTRDDVLNATRGTFFSNSFEVAPPGLGTSFQYVKDFSQYFRYRRVRKNLVWASGYRGGIAKAFGPVDLVPAEQFLAGGGTTLRGFKQDQLTLEPGNGLLIMNQELRFPLFRRFGGVTFFDVGNIYHDVKSVRPWDLRYSPGIGLRIATPLMLFRFDFGLNLSTRSGEPPRRFVFGIGQAF